ncbi:hypothetical protein HW555_004811 [Spodoptera exigua]|uniref:Uncharacterized protein n=1 Tax=Spodoptera exigua TaxID=7107 RepID=A0A835GKZ0_SPOEX|nr:hypothetical protein HW555_004811 [Spodoptera exigua]
MWKSLLGHLRTSSPTSRDSLSTIVTILSNKSLKFQNFQLKVTVINIDNGKVRQKAFPKNMKHWKIPIGFVGITYIFDAQSIEASMKNGRIIILSIEVHNYGAYNSTAPCACAAPDNAELIADAYL